MTDYNSLNKSAIETQVSEDIKDQSTNFEGNTKGSFSNNNNNKLSLGEIKYSKIDLDEIKKSQNQSKKKNEDFGDLTINAANNIFPYCIVWTHLPLISFLLPFIGHTGICDSKGKIYDFAGSKYIGEDELSFGDPIKYVQLQPCKNWDRALAMGNEKYSEEDHNLFCNNCHSHVACVLNFMKYKNKSSYNMIYIWWYCLIYSKYTSWCGIFKTYMGWIIIALVIFLTRILGK